MERIPEPEVRALNILQAVIDEANARRNLVPPEPWLDVLARYPQEFANWVALRLRVGATNSPAAIVNTRKSGQGVRPVPIVGIAERIAYRALTNHVVQGLSFPTRSLEDYRQFANGPILQGLDGSGDVRSLLPAHTKYVAEADVAAFYQYVDHDLLKGELEFQVGRVYETGVLIDLLGEIQGTAFGLPQLLDPSDLLSEVYIRMLERDLVRQGLVLWRYNDDFRLLANGYDEAQLAVEQVSDAARRLGLVLSDQKTHISRLVTYIVRNASVPVDEDDAQIDVTTLSPGSNDYAGSLMSPEEANGVLRRISLPPRDENRLDLKNLRHDDVKLLRSALNSLAHHEDEGGLRYLVSLTLFVPVLTPKVCTYLISMFDAHASTVDEIWDTLTQNHADSLSDWQRAWLVYVARICGMLALQPDGRLSWVRGQLRRNSDLLHAEVSLCLAQGGAIEFSELDVSLRVRPEALSPWYVLGMKELHSIGLVNANQISAVKQSSPLYRLLLEL
ncbi:RNA-directed DNA polymerase [Dactylosporangium roseum]|uniref:RNA-directed DNA polymerase n=1 Tax=Dactylosporangium roseum TaxID=47989 RepID=A0ABY5Z1S7_9ACTN|nr:RNA-directed DNA polymerase [Dactylosporangium roseum]UWZ35747.1 RNA-directed DNA polymerase [Dactylosporangium roseum]